MPKRSDWVSFLPSELPPSKTVYSQKDAAPCSACDGVYEQYPKTDPCDLDVLVPRVRDVVRGALHVGMLRKWWNAHPEGSIVAWDGKIEDGFVIVDVPRS